MNEPAPFSLQRPWLPRPWFLRHWSPRSSSGAAFVIALVLALPFVQACGGKKKPLESQGVTITSAAASAAPARWRPVALPLVRNAFSEVYAFPSASVRLHIDQSGTRWRLSDPLPPAASASGSSAPSAGAASSAASMPPAPVAASALDLDAIEHRTMDEGELLMVTRDGRLLKLTSPLAVPVPAIAARLPEGAVAASLRRFHGAVTVRAKRGLFWSRDGQRFEPVPGLPGHASGEAILDARGVGIGLFFPERVAITRDAGKSWAVVSLPDAHVTHLEHRGDRLVMTPGGIRDGFAREVDPLTGDVGRSAPSISDHPLRGDELDLTTLLRLGPRGYGRKFRGREPEEARGPTPLRFVPGDEPRGFRRGPAIDGDTVLTTEEGHDGQGQRTMQVSTGLLGEALVPFAGGALASCNVRASALCGVRAAVICDHEITHFREGSEIGRTSVPNDTAIAYDGEGRLWTASPDRDAGGGAVVLRRFPIDGALPSPGEEHRRVLGGTTPRFVGGCRTPALWAVGETAATRLRGTGFEETRALPKTSSVVGVAAGGALVMSTGGELVFLPEDRRVPVKAHLPHHVSFSADGQHALLSTPSGQLEQSDDGGASFVPVPTPPVLTRQPIICGRTRCQLGPSALREGFGRGAEATPAWAEAAREEAEPRLLRYMREEERGAVVAIDHLRCVRDDTLFRGAPTGKLAPRIGRWLFSSVSAEDDSAPRGYFGGADGAGEEIALPPRTAGGGPRAGLPVSLAGGVGRAWLPSDSDIFDPAAGRASVQWEPAAKPRALGGRYADVIERDDIWISEGNGGVFADATTGEMWRVGADHDERRPLAISHLPRFEARGGHLGLLFPARDDVWYGVFPARASPAPEHVATLSLLAVHADRPSEDRVVAVGSGSALEIAVGLLSEGDHAALVTIERADVTDEIELRARSVSAQLQLGDGRSIPGTRGPEGRLLRLPTCAADAPGALLRLDARTPRRVTVGDRQVVGYLVRLARITPEAACLERSYLVENRGDFTPQLVVAGNEGVGFARDGGIRCTLVAPDR